MARQERFEDGREDGPQVAGSQRRHLRRRSLRRGRQGRQGRPDQAAPLRFDKYDPETFNPWKIEKNGKTLEPLMKSAPSPWSLAYKKRTYSPNRIKYPLKRVDWDPKGERNPQNRGKSKYVRISWDEATAPRRRRGQAHLRHLRPAGHPGAG